MSAWVCMYVCSVHIRMCVREKRRANVVSMKVRMTRKNKLPEEMIEIQSVIFCRKGYVKNRILMARVRMLNDIGM